MSLDLYAGSLARYYSRDFETPQQRAAREFNLNYNLVYDGAPPDWPSREVAAAKIVEFKNHIDEKQKHEFPDLTDWDDSVVDYRTEQLCREALDALLIVAAYERRPDLKRPKRLFGALDSDCAYAEAIPKKYYLGAMAILESQIFIPSARDKTLFVKDPMGWDQGVTTTGNLKWALGHLAGKAWKGHIDPNCWFARGPALAGTTMVRREKRLPWQSEWVEKHEEAPDDVVLHNAEYAFGVFTLMLEFAEKRRVPIRHDA